MPKAVRRTRDCLSPLRMMNPESQKIGSPTKKPVMDRAAGARFSPTRPSIKLAIRKVAPLRSSSTPSTVPRMMTKPIFFMVSPNPSFSVSTILSKGIPEMRPNNKAVRNNTKKGFMRQRAVHHTINPTLPNNKLNNQRVDIGDILLKSARCSKKIRFSTSEIKIFSP